MKPDEICYLSAVALAAVIRAKELLPVEVTTAVLEQIDRWNPAPNAFCTSMADEARKTAQRGPLIKTRILWPTRRMSAISEDA